MGWCVLIKISKKVILSRLLTPFFSIRPFRNDTYIWSELTRMPSGTARWSKGKAANVQIIVLSITQIGIR